jgi:hypothetical protein
LSTDPPHKEEQTAMFPRFNRRKSKSDDVDTADNDIITPIEQAPPQQSESNNGCCNFFVGVLDMIQDKLADICWKCGPSCGYGCGCGRHREVLL